MRTLEFKVDGQVLKKRPGCDFSNLVANTVGYLKVKFYCDSAWNKCKKAASFWVDDKEYAILLDRNNECDIPPEVLNSKVFYVSLTGARSDGYRIPTNKYKIRQEVY